MLASSHKSTVAADESKLLLNLFQAYWLETDLIILIILTGLYPLIHLHSSLLLLFKMQSYMF